MALPARRRTTAAGDRITRTEAPRIALKLAAWSFLLNFAWEMGQARFFVGMLQMPAWEATKLCLRASAGDAAMIVAAYAIVAVAARDARWLARPQAARLAACATLAAAQALALEAYSVGAGRWSYVAGMPVAPILGVGLAPLLQWLLLPLAALAIVRRTLRSRAP